ncbi:MAG: DUF1365 domain-containing protein [Nocardioidaceae bacterium]
MTNAVTVPALVRGEVRHARFHPVKHAFRYRTHQWLIDVDHPNIVPRYLRSLVSFQPRDHLGSPDASLGQNVRGFLAAQGVSWAAHRVLMLTNARCLGYVFDPLTVYWCFDSKGALEGVLAEVHNTYGERHGYVVQLDERGSGHADKAFYVSPFFGVFGSYQLKFVLDGDSVGAFISLRQDDRVVFTGSFTGQASPVTPRRVVAVAVRSPLMPQRVAALIRLHGAQLWLRRLPVVRRLPHAEQDGSR